MSSLGWPQTTAAEHVFNHEPLEIAEPQEPQFPVFLNAAQKKKLKMQQARQEREKLRKRQEAEEMESAEREMEARRRERMEKEWAELQREKAMLAETTTVDHDSPKCPTPPAEDASSSPIRAPSPSLPLPPPFTTVRAELICQVHLEILNGGSFSDTNIHLYSRRNRAGASYAPRVLALNRRILEAASPEFGEYVFADTAPVNSDAYLGDSDLEDDEADDSDLPGSLTVTSLPDSFDYQEPETPKTEEDITTRLGDADLLTDDEFVRFDAFVYMLV
ncbi:hypothetical protein EUX98_g1699 [Antrodiella citrinella]|uniref:Uncharacterized protein n=1 Tax=Antrodiella citrinella TaxID=2447956 RepID=A0A4S4N374_9APHY|nr:hypothetical protein EUX98_g1699 [Antrodiella citrinella]